jgi:hypothetical protein
VTLTNQPAGWILDSAKKTVCQERTQVHGETGASFNVIAEWWQNYLRVSNTHRHKVPLGVNIIVDATDVAELMSLLKKVRFLFGDHNNPENFTDDVGYVSLAGMFLGIKPTNIVEQEPAPRTDPPNSPYTGVRKVVDLNAVEARMREGTSDTVR